MEMVKGTYHPNAYLSHIRNVKRGLKARSAILSFLEKDSGTARNLAQSTGMHYTAVMHHITLLKNEEIIEKQGKKAPFVWALTGKGQKRL